MGIYVVFRRYITLVPHKLSISALESCLESQVFQSLQELCPVNEICRLANNGLISLLDLLECPTVSKPTVLCTAANAANEFCTEACLQAVAQHLPNQQFNSSSLRQTVACLQ